MSYTRLVVFTLVIVAAAVGLSGCAGASAATLAPQVGMIPAAEATPVHDTSACAAAPLGTASGANEAPATACTLRSNGAAGAALAGLPVAAQDGPSAAKVDVDGSGSYTNVQAVDLAAMMKAKNFKLINVHTPYAGEIEGTDLWLPYDQVEQRLGELPADKTSRIVLYCRSGMMSGIAARALVKLGYTDVWNLDGGMGGWGQAGYSLVTKK